MRPRSVRCLLSSRLKYKVHEYLGLFASLADPERVRFRVAIASRGVRLEPDCTRQTKGREQRRGVPFRLWRRGGPHKGGQRVSRTLEGVPRSASAPGGRGGCSGNLAAVNPGKLARIEVINFSSSGDTARMGLHPSSGQSAAIRRRGSKRKTDLLAIARCCQRTSINQKVTIYLRARLSPFKKKQKNAGRADQTRDDPGSSSPSKE